MGEVVSLRRARRAKSRTESEARAAVNRAAFGRTKAEKLNDRLRREHEAATLDGARRGD